MSKLRNYITAVVALLLLSMQLPAQLTQVSVDKLSDQQLISLLSRQNLLGLSAAQFELKAQEAGMAPRQILLAKERLERIDPFLLREALGKTKLDDKDPYWGRLPVLTNKPERLRKDSVLQIFGADIFEKEGISFEPNLSVPTPSNYRLGVNDELIIDVFGLSESTKKLRVSADGDIRYPNFGPIRVAGLSMEEAREKIKSSLKKIYPALRTGQTNLAVSLGQIRTIRITLVGELNQPGSYALPSLATVMHAIHAAGGPNEIGSFRNIELIRAGKMISNFDLYSFLLKGDLSGNVLLQDDDIIRVPAYKKRVAVKGAIKKPAIYDLGSNESTESLLDYAGGMADIAYKEIIRVKRMGASERQIFSIRKNEFSTFPLISGDTLVVDTLANKFTNRVQVEGAVHYPGEYGLSAFPTLKDLMITAQLKEEALLERAIIRRLRDDLSPEIISFSPLEIIKGGKNLSLQNNDSVFVYDREKVKEPYLVRVEGEIRKPGSYPFAAGMSVEDLILTAGGYRDGASSKRIEISRRIKNEVNEKDSLQYSLVTILDVEPSYGIRKIQGNTLEPFDIVYVRRSPEYKEQSSVTIEGEILYPGKYTLKGASERVSDIINRAGGLKSNAFPRGAILIRKTFQGTTASDSTIFSIKNELVLANNEAAVKSKIDKESNSLAEDTLLQKKELAKTFTNQRRVALDLVKAINEQGSSYDLILEEGDILKIPRTLQTVQSFGAVNYPQQITYKRGMSFKQLINLSGGFSPNASKKKSYVLEANGKVRSTFQLFGLIRLYPRISAGAEAYIPLKKEKNPLSRGETLGITTGLVSLAGVMLAIINSLK
jgi:protein involved in polysaccharide export with SLBB domain